MTGRRWTTWFLAVAGAWMIAGWVIVPAIIRSAFEGGVFGFLGVLMPGRDVNGVDVYLAQWDRLPMPVLTGLAAVWIAVLVNDS